MEKIRVIYGKFEGYEGIKQRETWLISVDKGVERSAIVKLFDKATRKVFIATVPNTSLVRC